MKDQEIVAYIVGFIYNMVDYKVGVEYLFQDQTDLVYKNEGEIFLSLLVFCFEKLFMFLD